MAPTPGQEVELLRWMMERQSTIQTSLGAPEKWWLAKLQSGDLLPGRGWINIRVMDLSDDYIQQLRCPGGTPQHYGEEAMIRLLGDLVPGLVLMSMDTKDNGKVRYIRYYEFPGLEECRSHFETMYGKQNWNGVSDSWENVGLARIRPKRET